MRNKSKYFLGSLVAATVMLAGCAPRGTEQPPAVGERPTAPAPGTVPREPGMDAMTPRAEQPRPEEPMAADRQQMAQELRIVSIDESVQPGDTITVRAQTSPNTQVKIDTEAWGLGVPGLAVTPDRTTKTTDDQGFVEWQVRVEQQYRADKLPIVLSTEGPGPQFLAVESVDVHHPAERHPDLAADFHRIDRNVTRGERVTVSVQAEQGSNVDIDVAGASPMDVPLLGNQVIGPEGRVEWTFRVDQNYRGDKVPIVVTVRRGDEVQKLVESIELPRLAAEPSREPAL